MDANVPLENMNAMEIFVFFLGEAEKDTWNALALKRLREGCQLLKKDIQASSDVLSKDWKANTYLLAPLILYTKLAFIRGLSLENSLDKAGYIDTLEELGDIVQELGQHLQKRTLTICFKNKICEWMVATVMLIEVAVANDKKSCLKQCLNMVLLGVLLITSSKTPLLSYQLPSSWTKIENQKASSSESLTLAALLIQCISRLLCHVTKRRPFFEKLHTYKNMTTDTLSQLGSQLEKDRDIFITCLRVLGYILHKLSTPCTSKKNSCLYLLPTEKYRYYSKASYDFLKAITPGILSQMVHMLVFRDAFKLRGVHYVLQIIEFLVIPLVTKKHHCLLESKIKTLSCTYSEKFHNPNCLSLVNENGSRMEEDLVMKMEKVLVRILETLLQWMLDHFHSHKHHVMQDRAFSSNREEFFVDSLDSYSLIIEKIYLLSFSLASQWLFQTFVNATRDKTFMQLRHVTAQAFLTSVFLLKENKNRLNLDVTVFSNELVLTIADNFSLLQGQLKTRKEWFSFCSSDEICRFLLQFVVFLNGVLCFSSKSAILMEQALCSCIQLVKIEWRLSRQFMVTKTESFFDVITNWVDASPDSETFLDLFRKTANVSLESSKRCFDLEEYLHKTIFGERIHVQCENYLKFFTLQTTIASSMTLDTFVEQVLGQCMSLIHRNVTVNIQYFRAIAQLLKTYLSPNGLVNSIVNFYGDTLVNELDLTSNPLNCHMECKKAINFYSLNSMEIVNRMNFLSFIILMLSLEDCSLQKKEEQVWGKLVHIITEDISAGGCWVEPLWLYEFLMMTSGKSQTDDFVCEENRIVLVNLYQTVLMVALSLVLDNFLKLQKRDNVACYSDLLNKIWKRCRKLSYGVLKLCASQYRWLSLGARFLLERIMDLSCLRLQAKSNKCELFFNEMTPFFLDSLVYELNKMNNNYVDYESKAHIDFLPENALVAILLFASDSLLVGFTDIVHELTYNKELHMLNTKNRRNKLYFLETIGAFRARAAIVKRFCGIIVRHACNAQKESSFSGVSEHGDVSVMENVHEKALCLLQNAVYGKNKMDNSFLSNFCANVARKQTNLTSNVTNQENAKECISEIDLIHIIEMARSLLNFSKPYLFHNNPFIQYFAHLTCFYCLYCQSFTKHAFLPQIHQMWEPLKDALLLPIVEEKNSEKSYMTVLLSVMSMRCVIEASGTFFHSRFMEEIFPKIHSFFQNHSPINQQSCASQCNSLRLQVSLLKLLHTASYVFSSTRQSDTLQNMQLCIKFLIPGIAVELQHAALYLFSSVVEANPENAMWYLLCKATKNDVTSCMLKEETLTLSALRIGCENVLNTVYLCSNIQQRVEGELAVLSDETGKFLVESKNVATLFYLVWNFYFSNVSKQEKCHLRVPLKCNKAKTFVF